MIFKSKQFGGRFFLLARLVVFLLLIVFMSPDSAIARKRIDEDKKYQVLATMISKFLYYIEWPKLVVDSNDKKNIEFCIFGAEYIEDDLVAAAALVSSKSNISINLHRDTQIVDTKTCNVAFVGDQFKESGKLFQEIAKYPILSITEESEGMKGSGIIEFYTKKNLSFRIDNAQAEIQNIKIKASLLKLASEVKQ